ncbi:hypothetical protein AB833_06195 [Chromatiales bacterium (ex Bugula neritina AB1)]|nr:hypothetical protein AB833_06195 [Chromatiales bacterium (ex Bugula neritina AB1)]
MNASNPVNWRRNVVWLAFGLSIYFGAKWNDVALSALFDSQGISNAGDILSGLLQPDFSPDFLGRIVWLSLESLLIGILGTVLSLVIGISIALIAIQVPALPDSPDNEHYLLRAAAGFARWSARFFLGLLRTIPEIVWAYLFVRLIGLGPGAAVMAIGLTVGGSIGKLYSELAEAAAPGPIQALRANGANRFSILLFAVIPQVIRQWLAYGLFRMECNIRTGTILGVVGAGGLGAEIALSIRYFEFDKLATALLAVLLLVIFLEFVSAYLRKAPLRYTIALIVCGTFVSVLYLKIPWMELFTGDINFIGEIDISTIAPEFVTRTLWLVLETLGMAWVATMSAAIIAFFLAPVASATLFGSSYLPDTYTGSLTDKLASWGLLGVMRLVLQFFRAMPELTFALVFVVWVGPGAFAGILAIGVHSVGVLGRLYTDIYEEVEPGPPRALQATGAGVTGVWLFSVLPQVSSRLIAYTLFRFEVNIRATAMVGFVGAGGIGDALHTAISLFHFTDLAVLLLVLLVVVTLVDMAGDRIRRRLLSPPGEKAAARPLIETTVVA